MQILHLDSSVLGTASVSRQLSAEIVARQKALHSGISVVSVTWPATRPFICPAPIWPLSKGQPAEDAIINADLLKGDAYMDELFASDIIVIGAPMYNFKFRHRSRRGSIASPWLTRPSTTPRPGLRVC